MQVSDKEMAPAVRECHESQLGHLDPGQMSMLVQLLRKAREPHEPADSQWR